MMENEKRHRPPDSPALSGFVQLSPCHSGKAYLFWVMFCVPGQPASKHFLELLFAVPTEVAT